MKVGIAGTLPRVRYVVKVMGPNIGRGVIIEYDFQEVLNRLEEIFAPYERGVAVIHMEPEEIDPQ